MKKKAKKKAKKKLTPKVNRILTLAERKELVMDSVPIMPCSALSNDVRGRMYAYTRAEQVYQTYRKAMKKYGLQREVVEVRTEHPTYTKWTESGYVDVRYCLAVVKIFITCPETKEQDYCVGIGGGDNEVWSPQSAMTVAVKQALLMYFETAWPQPEEFVSTVKKALSEIDVDSAVKVMQDIVPVPLMNNEEVRRTMMDFFANFGL